MSDYDAKAAARALAQSVGCATGTRDMLRRDTLKIAAALLRAREDMRQRCEDICRDRAKDDGVDGRDYKQAREAGAIAECIAALKEQP